MIEKICECCSKKYLVKNYRKDTARFCSRSCASKMLYNKEAINRDKSYLIGNQFRKGKKPSYSFQKGHIPWNKGLKGIHLSEKTEFKKGHISNNKVEVGTIKKRTDRNGKVRNFIKIKEPNVWERYYIFLWKSKNGEIPKGYVLHHINKISDDDRLENLVCISRKEHIEIHRKDLQHKENVEINN